jgi:glutamyl-tRNA synthetase
MDKKVRVRFAPSPTGPLHIGGVRTALYNYLFARKHQGVFILRIEDTDRSRYVPGAEKYIIESLKWLGLNFDEGPGSEGKSGPCRQSERIGIYRRYADYLISNNRAYLAFDSPEELEEQRMLCEKEKESFKYDVQSRMRLKNSLTLSEEKVQALIDEGFPYVVRIKIPENREIEVKDLVRGTVKVHSGELDDKVLFKSDAYPTYHLANVVDDHLMQISHVIRGEEWLPSAPLHVLLYEFLDWQEDIPAFAHLPLIMKPTGKGKLSKRDGDKGGFPVFPIAWQVPESNEIYAGYRESGYLPEAVNNILAFLGWNPGQEKEIFSMKEMIESFSLERVGRSGARFDPEKARWFNHKHIQITDNNKLALLLKEQVISKGLNADNECLKQVVALIKERVHLTSDLWDQADYFFMAPESYDAKVISKRWKENTAGIINDIKDILSELDDFSAQQLEQEIKSYIEEKELGFAVVMNPLRLCIVGGGHGVHLFDIMAIIGKKESISRIDRALEQIEKKEC